MLSRERTFTYETSPPVFALAGRSEGFSITVTTVSCGSALGGMVTETSPAVSVAPRVAETGCVTLGVLFGRPATPPPPQQPDSEQTSASSAIQRSPRIPVKFLCAESDTPA